VQFARPDYLVFGGTEEDGAGDGVSLLRAARFDMNDYSIRSDPVVVQRDVWSSGGEHSYSVSNNGILAYTQWQGNRPPTALDRDGTATEMQVSNIDGRWAFAAAKEHPWLFLGGDEDIWRFDRSTGIPEKLYTGTAFSPIPGPGDSLVAFLYWRPQEACKINLLNVSSGAVSELIGGECLFITDWSADGQHLLLENSLSWMPDSLPNLQIWSYSLAEDSLSLLVARNGDVRDGALSPDGRWVAFSSAETGTPEVYVRRCTSRGAAVRISRTGGRWPKWNDNGQEIYFLSPDGAVYVADVTSVFTGRAPSAPRVLFRNPLGLTVSFLDTGIGFAATPDGSTFFIRPPVQSHTITLIQNWPALMERR